MLVFWFLQLELWAEAPGIVTPRSVAGSLGWEEPPLFPAVFLGCAHTLVGCLWESCKYFPSHKCKSLYSAIWRLVFTQNFTKKLTSYKAKRNQCTNILQNRSFGNPPSGSAMCSIPSSLMLGDWLGLFLGPVIFDACWTPPKLQKNTMYRNIK